MKIHLVMGATGAGKTTYAARLAAERDAVSFIVDDWLARLFVPDAPKENVWPWALERVERCERQIWKTAQEILHRGIEVVLDINMMNREVRARQRARAAELGFPISIYYLDVPREVRWARVAQRNEEKGDTYAFPVSRAFFDFVETVIEPPTPDELADAIVVRAETT